MTGPAALLDERAFTALVGAHRRALYRHCLRMLRSPERAEDAVQETLLRAWRARDGFGGRASPRTWLYRIATHTCLDELRRDRPVVTLDEDAALPAPPDQEPDAVAEAGEALATALGGVMRVLPGRQRAVLVLRGILDVPAAETARLLDTTPAAVNSALQRARTRLAHARPVPAGRDPAPDYAGALRRDDVARVIALARADAAVAA
ncbi:MAG: sigma-70 family RNA polymerase sigma factor [Pseudonocardia sp.]